MGLGLVPAIIALVLYSLLILVRNIATGIREVSAELVDAADGMGYGTGARLCPDRAAAGAAGDRGRHPHHRGDTDRRSRRSPPTSMQAASGDLIFQGITQDFGEKIVTGARASPSPLAILCRRDAEARVELRLRAATAGRA